MPGHCYQPSAAHIRRVWSALQAASRCRALVLFLGAKCMLHFGAANTGCAGGSAVMGPICRKVLEAGRGNYLANLALYPGPSAWSKCLNILYHIIYICICIYTYIYLYIYLFILYIMRYYQFLIINYSRYLNLYLNVRRIFNLFS